MHSYSHQRLASRHTFLLFLWIKNMWLFDILALLTPSKIEE